MNADIVLVKPGSQKELYADLSDFNMTAIEPPFWGALLAAYLRNRHYRVELFDAEVECWSWAETARRVREANPTLVAIVVSGSNPSASTMNMIGAGGILAHLKEIAPELPTMLLGLHPSALPERTLRDEQADFVCVGEGFHTLPTLIDALKTKQKTFEIPGLWYKRDGQILSNPRAPVVADLDRLPMPAWDMLPMERYRAHNWHCFDSITARQPYGVIYTSLGCPFHCSFCCINALFEKPGIRYRSPDRVIEELDVLVKRWGIRNIKIMDEMFAMKESHVARLCDLIIERGYDLNMWAYARVNTVTPTMLRKMKQAGINWVAYGFESGSKRVLAGVGKGYNRDSVDPVVKMTYDEGLYIGANFIFGLPDDDRESMQETLDLALDINAEWGNFYATMAHPGSKLYEEALEKGWPLPQSWQGYSQYSYETLPLPTKYLSGSEVLAFRDQAFTKYFTSPRYEQKVLKTFGPETLNYIREMVSKPLKRRFVPCPT